MKYLYLLTCVLLYKYLIHLMSTHLHITSKFQIH